MSKLLVFLSIATILVGSSALAVVDPDPDMIGVYFDVDANEFCAEAPIGGGFPAYLCLTNASYISDPDLLAVSGWECNIHITEGIFVLDWGMQGNGPINFSAAPDFIVGLQSPTAWAPSIVLMEITVGVFTPGAIEFTVFPAINSSFEPPLPGYTAGDNPNLLISLGYSGGTDDGTNLGIPLVCAVLNGDCTPIANEDMTWGGIKSIYK